MTTRQIVPMASVADVERSITFYAHLGFEVGNNVIFTHHGTYGSAPIYAPFIDTLPLPVPLND